MPEVCLLECVIPTCYATYCSSMSVDKASEKEVELWDEILKQKGLSMEAGRSDRIDYGAKYFDTSIPHDYQERMDNYMVAQEARGYECATKLLRLMDTGMSMNAAAKSIGMTSGNASITLKRYRKNFESVISPCYATDSSSEDSNVD